MKKLRLAALVAFILALVFMVGCAGTQLKNPAEMTPKEKATFAMKLFVKQTQDLQAMKAMPLTAEQKALLVQKENFLKQSAVTIDLYNGYIDGGLQPTPALEAAIMDIINKLLIK